MPCHGKSCSSSNPILASSEPANKLLDCGVSGNVVVLSDCVADNSAMPRIETPLCAEMNGCKGKAAPVVLV